MTALAQGHVCLPPPSAVLAPAIEHLDPCCAGFGFRGPEFCTCWAAVYEPVPVAPALATQPTTMERMCGDCAFRRDSPERRGDQHAASNWEGLQRLVETESPFWCHDGLPRLKGWSHPPSGIWIPQPGTVDDYRPTIVDDVPYRADGHAGSRCAGWAAAVDRQRHRDEAALPTPVTPLADLLCRRPELRGVGVSDVLEARWTA